MPATKRAERSVEERMVISFEWFFAELGLFLELGLRSLIPGFTNECMDERSDVRSLSEVDNGQRMS